MSSKSTQQRPPPYELFFAPLEAALDPKEHEMVQFAYFASKYGHARQLRDDGRRYFDHPKGAAWIYISEFAGRDPRMIIDLLLHDISEDAYLLSPYRIRLNFGLEVALDVRALTKLPEGKETIEEYIARIIRKGAWAIFSKLVDVLHNTRDLGGCPPEKRARQIEEKRNYHLRLLIPALRECGEPWAGYAEPLERKITEAMRQW